MKVRHRFSPIGNGAISIRGCNVLKCKEGSVVPKRVQECDTAIKIGSYAGGTTDLEVDRSELYRHGIFGRMAGYRRARPCGVRLDHQERTQPNRPYSGSCFHGMFPAIVQHTRARWLSSEPRNCAWFDGMVPRLPSYRCSTDDPGKP